MKAFLTGQHCFALLLTLALAGVPLNIAVHSGYVVANSPFQMLPMGPRDGERLQQYTFSDGIN